MVLNENKAWPNVDPVAVAAFIAPVEKKLLKTGMQLYKFNTSGRSLIFDGGASPWWFPLKPLGDIDVGLEGVIKFAKTVGVPVREYARLIAAVTEEWNKMDVIMKAELKANVYGFWGEAAQQKKKVASKINLTGRGWQLYIPGLTGEHIKELETVGVP